MNPYCPMCDAPVAMLMLGTLGNVTHYRCRNCGWVAADEQPLTSTPK